MMFSTSLQSLYTKFWDICLIKIIEIFNLNNNVSALFKMQSIKCNHTNVCVISKSEYLRISRKFYSQFFLKKMFLNTFVNSCLKRSLNNIMNPPDLECHIGMLFNCYSYKDPLFNLCNCS